MGFGISTVFDDTAHELGSAARVFSARVSAASRMARSETLASAQNSMGRPRPPPHGRMSGFAAGLARVFAPARLRWAPGPGVEWRSLVGLRQTATLAAAARQPSPYGDVT